MDTTGSKQSILTSVTWEGPVQEYTLKVRGFDLLVRDRNGDGTIEPNRDDIEVRSGELNGRKIKSEVLLAEAQSLIALFRSNIPEKLFMARRQLLAVPYSGGFRNNMCVPVFEDRSRFWEWTLPAHASAAESLGIVSASIYDHNRDGKIDELAWEEDEGLRVNLRAWKHIVIDRRPHVDECDQLDLDRRGVEAMLSLFDAFARGANDAEEMRSIFLLSGLSFLNFSAEAIWSQHLHEEDMAALAEEAAERTRFLEEALKRNKPPEVNFRPRKPSRIVQ